MQEFTKQEIAKQFIKTEIEQEGRPYIIAEGYFKENGKVVNLTYYQSKTDPDEWGTEYYTGPNYVEPYDSKAKSFSRNWKQWQKLPAKYALMAEYLKGMVNEYRANH